MHHRSVLFLTIAFVAPLLLSGCVLRNVVALEPQGKKIKLVHEADKPLDCDVLADVNGTSRSEDEKKAIKGAENDIRNHAAEYQGANFVVVETQRTRHAGTGPYMEAFLAGKSLKCITPEMAAEREKEQAEAKEREEREKAERERKEELERINKESEEGEHKGGDEK